MASSSAVDATLESPIPPPFRLSEIENIFGGNRLLMKMALSKYDTNAYEHLLLLWEERNYQSLGRVAHQLKGSTSYICANDAKRAAERLEQAAKALSNAETSDMLLAEVHDALIDVKKELNRIAPTIKEALEALASEG